MAITARCAGGNKSTSIGNTTSYNWCYKLQGIRANATWTYNPIELNLLAMNQSEVKYKVKKQKRVKSKQNARRWGSHRSNKRAIEGYVWDNYSQGRELREKVRQRRQVSKSSMRFSRLEPNRVQIIRAGVVCSSANRRIIESAKKSQHNARLEVRVKRVQRERE